MSVAVKFRTRAWRDAISDIQARGVSRERLPDDKKSRSKISIRGFAARRRTRGRPALNNSNTIGMKLSLEENSVIASRMLGQPIAVCVHDLDPAPDTSTFLNGFGASVSMAEDTIAFFADIGPDIKPAGVQRQVVPNGLFYCDEDEPHEAVQTGDPRPGGGTWSSFEESSTSGNWLVFVDENGDPDPSAIFIYKTLF